MCDQCIAIWTAVLTVSQEFVPIFSKAERDPAEAPEAEKEEDSANYVGCITEVYTHFGGDESFAFGAFLLHWCKIGGGLHSRNESTKFLILIFP